MSDKPGLNWMGLLPVGIFLALIGGFFIPGLLHDDPDTLPSAFIGRDAPAIEAIPLGDLPTFSSEVFADGQVKLVNFWASWCAPCVEEMPELARFAHVQGEDGVQVLGLALDTPEDVRGFLQRVPVDYPIVIETPGPRDASVQLGNAQGLLPYSVLFDAQGRMLKAKLGPFAHGEIDSWVK